MTENNQLLPYLKRIGTKTKLLFEISNANTESPSLGLKNAHIYKSQSCVKLKKLLLFLTLLSTEAVCLHCESCFQPGNRLVLLHPNNIQPRGYAP